MAKKGESFGHEALEPWRHLHVSAGVYDGGQCIARHEANYVQRDSCSYRWQAVKRALGEDKHIYKDHPGGLSGTAFRYRALDTARQMMRNRALERIIKKRPAEGDAHVEGKAFRTAFAPYPNQAHHLLPNSRLRESVFEVTKPAPEVTDKVFKDLLEEKYNLNHWKNVMILPCGVKDGGILGLPTHTNNHSKYSATVERAVKKALKPYEAVVESVVNGDPHPKVSGKKLKDALERISKKLHKMIVDSRSEIRDRYDRGDDISVNSLHPQVATALGV